MLSQLSGAIKRHDVAQPGSTEVPLLNPLCGCATNGCCCRGQLAAACRRASAVAAAAPLPYSLFSRPRNRLNLQSLGGAMAYSDAREMECFVPPLEA